MIMCSEVALQDILSTFHIPLSPAYDETRWQREVCTPSPLEKRDSH